MNPGRRRAMVLAASMGSAALIAAIVKPVRRSAGERPAVMLDTLFPRQFGDWRVDEVMNSFVRPADRQGRIAGIYDQLLERSFVDRAGHRIMLSVAFGSEQSANLQLHRPEVCYQASGYQVGGQHSAVLELAGQNVPVNRLHAELPGRFEPITYWTLLGDVVLADMSGFRWRRLGSALRGELLDGTLVRVSSIDPQPERAFALQARFADEMARAVAPAQRVKVIGAVQRG